MNSIRRWVYSFLVAVLVFTVLSLPILSRLFGPVVYLPAYAIVAIAAGAVTWSIFGWLGSTGGSEDAVDQGRLGTDGELSRAASDEDYPEMDVDQELEDLREN